MVNTYQSKKDIKNYATKIMNKKIKNDISKTRSLAYNPFKKRGE